MILEVYHCAALAAAMALRDTAAAMALRALAAGEQAASSTPSGGPARLPAPVSLSLYPGERLGPRTAGGGPAPRRAVALERYHAMFGGRRGVLGRSGRE